MAVLPAPSNSTPVTQPLHHALQPIHLQSQQHAQPAQPFGPAVHQELSNIKNMGVQILQKQKIKRANQYYSESRQGQPAQESLNDCWGDTT